MPNARLVASYSVSILRSSLRLAAACCGLVTWVPFVPAATADDMLRRIDQSYETLTLREVISMAEHQAAGWGAKENAVVATNETAARETLLCGERQWIDSVLEATLVIDSAAKKPGAGIQVLLRASADGKSAAVMGFDFGAQAFVIGQMNGGQLNTIVQTPFPLKLGQSYHLLVVADRAVYFCFVDGRFVLKAQDAKFADRPAGRAGLMSSLATGRITDLQVRSLKKAHSPFKFYSGNPIGVEAYSPTVILDAGKFKMWHTVQGAEGVGQAYAESTDGVHWDQPHGTAPVKGLGPKGEWGDGGESDAAVVKLGNDYTMWYPGRTTPAGDNWDGIGMYRSSDGVHWKPEAGNPQFYIGPLGSWEAGVVGEPVVMRDGDLWKMWYVALNQPEYGYLAQFGYAESIDGVRWRKSTMNPVFPVGGPGEWDSGWVTRASVLKLGDEEPQTRVYRGKGGSYHMFYAGHTSNDEFIAGVKRIGWAFSLDGVNWVRYDDPATIDPPFHHSDPILGWTDWGDWGYVGVRACNAVRSGDEVKIWTSGGAGYGGHFGTGLATAKVSDLLAIVEKAKADGKLKELSRTEIEATLHEPLPLSTWDDLAGYVLRAASARAEGREEAARLLSESDDAFLKRMTTSERRYFRTVLRPLYNARSRLKRDARCVVADPIRLDFGKPEMAKSCTLKSVTFRGVENEASVFQARGAEPSITFPACDFVADADLCVLELDVRVTKVAAWHGGVVVQWAADGGEFTPAQSVTELVRFPEQHHTLRAVLPWKKGQRITGIRVRLTADDVVILRSVTLHTVTFK